MVILTARATLKCAHVYSDRPHLRPLPATLCFSPYLCVPVPSLALFLALPMHNVPSLTMSLTLPMHNVP